MSSGPIIVPNEGDVRVEYAVEWTFPAGHEIVAYYETTEVSR